MRGTIPAFVLLTVLLTAAATGTIHALEAEEIIDRMEVNTVFDTARSRGAMIVNDRFGTKVSTFVSFAQGADTTLIEFTSLEEEGMKILRTEDEIYLFYPDAEELIRLQGAALRDSVMGSDMSYEDMTGGKDLLESYKVELAGQESIDGHPCYRIEMEALTRKVAYYRQTVWVDEELFIYRRVHKYSRSGKLLKELDVTDIQEISGRHIAMRMVLRDTLKRNSSTEFVLEAIDLDIPLPENTFSLGRLTW
jgi:outer membrane lipoprotein-sorting protein